MPPRTPPERIDIVEELWRKCVPNSTIEQSCAKDWGVTRRTIRSYLTQVVRRNAGQRQSAKEADKTRAAEFNRTRGMFEDIYFRGLEGTDGKGKGRDLKVAITAAHRRAQLLGQYPANRFEVTGANGKPLEVSPSDAVTKLLAELESVAGRGGEDPK